MDMESLQAYGADTQVGLERCMGSESVYLSLVGTVVDEERFERLKEALDEGSLDEAFEHAHALKGVLSNLALTPLCEPVYEITELLRSRTDTDYGPLMAEILERWEALKAL